MSFFYKLFQDPIEQAFFSNSVNDVEPVNVNDATLIGVEAEARKSLNFAENGGSVARAAHGRKYSVRVEHGRAVVKRREQRGEPKV